MGQAVLVVVVLWRRARAAGARPLVVLALAALLLTVAGSGQGVVVAKRAVPLLFAGAAPGAVRDDLAYGPRPGELLDLCLPRPGSGARPGVLIIHGGGWVGGNPRSDDGLCAELAARGFVAASLGYRLAPAHVWPAQVVDAQLAVRWLRAQAPRLGLDPARLCAMGDSAGGHLAVFLGVLATIHPGDEAGLYADQSPRVDCVVDEYGPTDLAGLSALTYGASIARQLLGGATPRGAPAAYRDASPVFAVSSHSAPMLIIQGDRDQIVPAAQSRELQRALMRAGVPVAYIAFAGGHGYSGLSPAEVRAMRERIIAYLVARERP